MDYERALTQIEQYSHQAVEYLSNKSNLKEIGKITAISVATYVVADKLYTAFFGPLSRLPGPFWSRFIEFPKFIYDRPSGTQFRTFLALHDKYGDVVRLGPNFVAVADKDMIKQALVTDDFPKAPIYEIFQKQGKYTLFSTTDPVWHKKRRRIVSPAFSIKYLNSLEPFMTKVTESLVQKIDADIAVNHDSSNYGTVDIWDMVQRLALDVIGETAFGQTFNMVEDNSHFVPEAISTEMRSSAISIMYPLLSKLILPNAGKTDPRLEEFLTGVIQNRLKPDSEKRKDILQFLIDVQETAGDDASLTPDAIMAETVLFLIAGSETTSNTIGFAMIELLRNPDKLKKLYEELDTVELEEGQTVFHHDQLKHLPYLNAVINETLRLDSVAASGLSRRVPSDTMLGGRVFLPKDTVVLCSLYHTQTNAKYWPQPEQFRPERWIESKEQNGAMNDLEAFFTFSAGSRNCIGKNFALQEMRITIATLLKTYEIKPIEQEMIDALDRRQFITLTVPKNSFSLKMKRRN